MKFLKKIASMSEAIQTNVDVLYATETDVKLVKPLPTYTVTFKDYDDSVISTKVYKQGETVTVPSNPTKEGYDFTGWTPIVSPTAVADAVYTAQYEEKYIPNDEIWYTTTDEKLLNIRFPEAFAYNNPIVEHTYGQMVFEKDVETIEGVKDGDGYMSMLSSNLKTIILPKTLKEIKAGTFEYKPQITSIGFYRSNSSIELSENGVEEVGACAFQSCSGLTSVTLPYSVTSIGNSAFYNCIYEA